MKMQQMHVGTNSTVSAPADSSDNQPPTPTSDQRQSTHGQSEQSQQSPTTLQQTHQQDHRSQPTSQHHHHHHQIHHPSLYSAGNFSGNPQMYQQDMHPYPSYLGYDQLYSGSLAGMDYSNSMQQYAYPLQNQSSTGGTSAGGGSVGSDTSPNTLDYKAMPQRFYSYLNNSGVHQLLPSQNHSIAPTSIGNGGASTAANSSSSVSNTSLSPRVVSSSSPQNSSSANTPHRGMSEVNSGSMSNRTPTPTTSKQCNKCGVICSTDNELNEHYTVNHSAQTSEDCMNSVDHPVPSTSDRNQYPQYSAFVKEEPPSSDILDLDSQKMVYTPQPDGEGGCTTGLQPPMHRPMSWSQDLHPNYMSTSSHMTDTKHATYYIKPEFTPSKPEFLSTNFTKPTDYGHIISSQSHGDDKSFVTNDLPAGNNPASSSPSEFPSTTTPQDNLTQYRTVEPSSSSQATSGGAPKGTGWKSNEPRRPKTYNCTACNKWFTSSGHLKRHYNTTLHKNAVKSSGQPDPATLPISAHHHPSRDPNSKHSRSNRQAPPSVPPESRTTPEFSNQFGNQSTNGFTIASQQLQSPTYHQYQQNSLTSSANGHPNGLAGPSVQASTQRGLLTTMNTAISTTETEDQIIINNNSNPMEMQEIQYQQQVIPQIQEIHQYPHNSNNIHQLEEYPIAISLQPHPHHQQQLLPQHLPSQPTTSHQQYQVVQHIHPHHPSLDHQVFKVTHTPSTMDRPLQLQPPPQQQQQQQYIINHLGTNITTITSPTANNTPTTIPSFQHLQRPVGDLQPNYHTTIGNNTEIISSANIPPTDFPPSAIVSFVDQIEPNGGPVQQLIQRFDDNNQCGINPTAVADPTNGQRSAFGNHGSPVAADLPPLKVSQNITDKSPTSHSPIVIGTVTDEQKSPSPDSNSTNVNTNHININSSIINDNNTINNNNMITNNIMNNNNIISMNNNNNNENINNNIDTVSKITKKPKSKRTKVSQPPPNAAMLPNGRVLCTLCHKDFSKVCYLTQHNMSSHDGDKNYRCDCCGKRFSTERKHDIHFPRHSEEEKPYKCPKCGRHFYHKTDLRRHDDSTHTMRKLFVCEVCTKAFCRRDHLLKHTLIHTRPKPVRSGGGRGKKQKKVQLTNPTYVLNSPDSSKDIPTVHSPLTMTNGSSSPGLPYGASMSINLAPSQESDIQNHPNPPIPIAPPYHHTTSDLSNNCNAIISLNSV